MESLVETEQQTLFPLQPNNVTLQNVLRNKYILVVAACF